LKTLINLHKEILDIEENPETNHILPKVTPEVKTKGIRTHPGIC